MRTLARILSLTTALTFSAPLLAEEAERRDFSVHAGLGLSMGSTQLSVAGSSASSSGYVTQGFALESGISIPFSRAFGGFISGEYSQMTSVNSSSGSSFLELGAQTAIAGKVGFYTGPLYFGGGFRQTNLTVKSIVAGRNSYAESTYAGGVPIGIVGFAFDARRKYRAALELQYATGTVPGTAPTTASLNYTEIMVGLRLFGLFD